MKGFYVMLAMIATMFVALTMYGINTNPKNKLHTYYIGITNDDPAFVLVFNELGDKCAIIDCALNPEFIEELTPLTDTISANSIYEASRSYWELNDYVCSYEPGTTTATTSTNLFPITYY